MSLRLFLLLVTAWLVVGDDPCPTLDYFLTRSPYLVQFDPHQYAGIWYELAFHDYTQFGKACGCTHLNWTLSEGDAGTYSDAFITTCPYEPNWLRKNYTVYMNGTANDHQYPFYIPETGFRVEFNNTVVYFRQSGDGDRSYDRAIQYQCKSEANAKRIFTGINFLSRTAFQSDAERQQAIDEMIQAATSAGVESKYLQDLKVVQWERC